MKMISKIANVALGLVLAGSSVFAQSLDDAKKAIDAEQYQKAKSMLKNLTTTQATKDENFFYLGWVYLVQDYPDSAKEQFMKGLAVNPKSALNQVGIGAVAHYNKDAAGTTDAFNKAMTMIGKKESTPWDYMGQAYLLLPVGAKEVSKDDATAAIAAVNKGKAANPKDDKILVTLGDAERALKDATAAYTAYTDALTLNPKNLPAKTNLGVILENAQNFEDAEKAFQDATALDPNFGPAYREWAETDKYWATVNRSVASAKIKEAVDHYQKYLSLTDESVESLLRYADFLYNAGDYATLEQVAAKLSKSANSNARVYRYIGYSAYETKDYANGLAAMNTWFSKATPDRVIPSDYYILGHLQISSGKDTAGGIATLKKFAALDTTQIEETYRDIAEIYRAKRDYENTYKAYQELISKVHGKLLLQDHLLLGNYAYFTFTGQARASKTNSAIKPDSSLLKLADTTLGYVQKNNPSPISATARLRANIADQYDTDILHIKGVAKPYWDQVIKIITSQDTTKWNANEKRDLGNAYAFKGNYALYHEHDEAAADAYYTKAKALIPNEYYSNHYFDNKKIAEENAKALEEYNKKHPKGATPAKKPKD